ncbi:Transcriptional regulatory protein RcsB [Caballeronia sp. SBC1]|uniref:response regulator transcription factor n=1 Tax=unclassified Caballeronia TaxID=2646786 RepID=UPI0013E1A1C1|nr:MULTISPECIES: response regulator transcription factor [unclassified Caballeronia]QIE22342.1 Transcriptional regulatory protein RcsB [Caballeronia sp. SBC2]QIN60411.1 Transcriptional regulatory protein RcsB [Caballeronia sp. SBC1]
MKLRIVLADDHPFVLLGIRATFSMDENLEVVAEAASAAELLRLLAYTPCDVLVTDFAMPEQGLQAEDGLRLIKRLRRDWPAISIVVLTSMSNVAILRSILAAGAMSLLNKVESMDELAAAVRFAGVGRRYLSTSIVSALAVAGAETDALGEGPRLSPREIEVVRMFASGLSITEIARFMKRDVRTISRQKRDAMSKLGVQNDPGLFAFARAHGMT